MKRSTLIKQCDKLFFNLLIKERGLICEICGRNQQLGTFHILSKGKYPRLRYHKFNCLIACWFGCHYQWHHNYFEAKDRIEPRIKKLRGDNYREELQKIDIVSAKIDAFRLNLIKKSLELELDLLKAK